MAIYRCEAKIISRGAGHSAVAAAAYRTGTKIRDERSGKLHDYAGRTKGVVGSVILRPDNSPTWTANTESLWNEVEKSERRKDAQLCREFVLALPKELAPDAQLRCAVQWAQSELVNKGMIAEVSLHRPKKGTNVHAHVLATLRTIEGEKFSAKKPREWNTKDQLLQWRESWATAVNAALEKAGRPERVDHRSLKDQRIDRLPQPKLGQEAVALKKRGIEADPRRFQEVRKVKLLNESLPLMRAVRKNGEVSQKGMGNTWWEKSIVFMSRTRDRVGKLVKGTWQSLLDGRRSKGQTTEQPSRSRE